mgnify:CR=1 FL=1
MVVTTTFLYLWLFTSPALLLAGVGAGCFLTHRLMSGKAPLPSLTLWRKKPKEEPKPASKARYGP